MSQEEGQEDRVLMEDLLRRSLNERLRAMSASALAIERLRREYHRRILESMGEPPHRSKLH